MLAKLGYSIPGRVCGRTRLFGLLDRVRKHSVIWIAAPAGSGKTILVTSYLNARNISALWYQMDQSDSDPALFFCRLEEEAQAFSRKKKLALPSLTTEYRNSLSAFTANYFRSLFEHVRPGSVVVFDNYQDAAGITAGFSLHDLFAQGFEQIPKGMNVIVVSREEPPAAYARLRANEKLCVIGWEEMQLTEEESGNIAKLRDKDGCFSDTTLKTLYEETRGWVAGLVLLTERVPGESLMRNMPNPTATQPVFDYFASEIFHHRDKVTQDFLLKTAFLPKVSAASARRLTGEEESEAMLTSLANRNDFTLRHEEGAYEYHPLFRVFLQRQAIAAYGAGAVQEIKRCSAEFLASEGDLQTAALLFEQAREWQALLKLVLTHAPGLTVRGQVSMIEAWLTALPAEVSNDNPWVAYWKGVCRLTFNPAEAREHFERAFGFFEQQKDASPLYLAWSGVIESFVLERNDFRLMQPWLDRYHLLSADRVPPSPEVESASIFAYIAGLIHARLDSPDLPVHIERAEALIRQDSDVNRRLARCVNVLLYHMWKGGAPKATALLEEFSTLTVSPETKPLVRLYWHLCKVMYAGGTGMAEESMRHVNEALAFAQESGVHTMDFQVITWGAWGQLCAGNVAAARALLQRSDPSSRCTKVMQAAHQHRVALVSLHQGNVAEALNEGRTALQLCRDADYVILTNACHIDVAYIYARHGDRKMALHHIAQGRHMAARLQSTVMMGHCAFTEAAIFHLWGEHDSTLNSLSEALPLMRETGAITPAVCPRNEAAMLYAIALDTDIESDYVRSIIKKMHLSPPSGYISPSWPWPVRIYALGRFEVFVDDVCVTASERRQKKPLDLLRGLIAFGGRGVPMARLAQTLWPDSDGDMAKHSLETALYRLRKLLGERCVELDGSQLTLKSDMCWVDVWNFEHLLEPDDILPPSVRAQQLFKLYRGSFMDGDDMSSVLVERERVHSKFLRIIDRLGRTLESTAVWDAAIECYQKGIEADPLAESLYRGLMRCYQKIGRIAEALAVFQRWRKTLFSVLGIQPAPETMTLFRQIEELSLRQTHG